MPEKPRPSADETSPESVFHWYIDAAPEQIRVNGREQPNLFRQRAIFVVHGMGEQHVTDSAAALRVGFEDSVPLVDPRHWDAQAENHWYVPQPFIADGHWGNYDKIEEFALDHWQTFNRHEQEFFTRVWRTRAINLSGTWWWFARSAWNLFLKSNWIAKCYYFMILPQLLFLIALLGIYPKTRRVVTGYLNDVRIFIEPRGDMEHAIAHRIEHKVGELFLRVLGLDWNLEPLPNEQKLIVRNKPVTFESVVWVSHSLGTVVSYKVLGDILRLCQRKRNSAADPDNPPEGVLRVERSLAAFVTFGSPLDKIKFLYPDSEVVQDWPAEYLPGGKHSLWHQEGAEWIFWDNYHYTSDPVSGRLDGFHFDSTSDEKSNLVRNFHTKGRKVLAYAHISYWKDKHFLTRLLNRSFPDLTEPWPPSNEPRAASTQKIMHFGSAIAYGILLPLAIYALAKYAWRVAEKLLS
ncbi:MAG TPA: hypothetical protein VLA12_00165 [Planctomycetaceae bacterium]|nr:hypothetical protein [Planctomycetaceae bacterium]